MCIQESGAKVTVPAKKQTPAAAKNGVAVVSKKKQESSSSSESDSSSDEEPVSSVVPNIFFPILCPLTCAWIWCFCMMCWN